MHAEPGRRESGEYRTLRTHGVGAPGGHVEASGQRGLGHQGIIFAEQFAANGRMPVARIEEGFALDQHHIRQPGGIDRVRIGRRGEGVVVVLAVNGVACQPTVGPEIGVKAEPDQIPVGFQRAAGQAG